MRNWTSNLNTAPRIVLHPKCLTRCPPCLAKLPIFLTQAALSLPQSSATIPAYMRLKNFSASRICYALFGVCCWALLTACDKSAPSDLPMPRTNAVSEATMDRSWTNNMVWIPSGKFMMGNTFSGRLPIDPGRR